MIRLRELRLRILGACGAVLAPALLLGLATVASLAAESEAVRSVRRAADALALARRLPGPEEAPAAALGAALERHDAAHRRTRTLVLGGGALVLLWSVGASLLLAGRGTRPLTRLTGIVERVAAGEAAPPLPVDTGDEIGRLGAAFGRLVAEVGQREEALDRARREAESFVDVQRDLAETLDLLPLLAKTARHARLLCRADLAYIAPFDPRAGVARVVAPLGERSAGLRSGRVEPGRGLAGRALASRAPFRTADFAGDPRLHDGFIDPLAAEGVVAVLAVPMILEQELIGLILVANRTTTAFTEQHEAILLRLAMPAALAIRNARLVAELGQERDLLAVRSRELARSEAQVRGILQAATDGILTVDPRGRITSVNRAVELMFGYPAQEVLARDLERLVPTPADEPEMLTSAVTPAGPAPRREMEGVRRDGSRFPIELSVSVVRTEHDHFFAVVVSDISERKRAQETRFRLAAIVDSSDDAVIGWTPDLRIASWNPGAERIYGYDAGEAVGQPVSVVVPPDRLDELRELIARVERGEHLRNQETVWCRKDGRRIDVAITVSATRDEAGRITGFSTIARDITARKTIERIKDEFIGTVSHELRTPLTAIRGHLELVLDGEAGPVTPLQREFLAVATQNTDRLGALINDLLDVEKVEGGGLRIREEPVDLAVVLRGVVATFRLEAERKGLGFRDEIPDRLVITGDRDRLTQVFSNLVSNAIKYTTHGEVGIQAGRRDARVAVVVHDTGAGISAEDRVQLFSKFFRSADAAVRDAGGTGLGLVIARGIVERHGGRIEVESEKGIGSRFTVLLP